MERKSCLGFEICIPGAIKGIKSGKTRELNETEIEIVIGGKIVSAATHNSNLINAVGKGDPFPRYVKKKKCLAVIGSRLSRCESGSRNGNIYR